MNIKHPIVGSTLLAAMVVVAYSLIWQNREANDYMLLLTLGSGVVIWIGAFVIGKLLLKLPWFWIVGGILAGTLAYNIYSGGLLA